MNESSKSRRVETLRVPERGHPAVGRERSCRFGNSGIVRVWPKHSFYSWRRELMPETAVPSGKPKTPSATDERRNSYHRWPAAT